MDSVTLRSLEGHNLDMHSHIFIYLQFIYIYIYIYIFTKIIFMEFEK